MYISLIYFFIPFFNRNKCIFNDNFKLACQNRSTNDDASMIPKRQLPRNKPIFEPKHNKPI